MSEQFAYAEVEIRITVDGVTTGVMVPKAVNVELDGGLTGHAILERLIAPQGRLVAPPVDRIDVNLSFTALQDQDGNFFKVAKP